MCSLRGKSRWCAAALALLFAPQLALAASTFATYQRVKNLTAGDAPAGAVVTAGQPGQQLRHLVTVYNRSNFEQTYAVRVQLPAFLRYEAGSAASYADGAWSDAAEPTDAVALHVLPAQVLYYRFATQIVPTFPNENAVLTVATTVTDATGSAETTANKIYVANYRAAVPLEAAYAPVTPAAQAQLKKSLEDERAFMETQFQKLLTNQKAPPVAAPPPAAAPDASFLPQLFTTLLAFFAALIFFKYRHYVFPKK